MSVPVIKALTKRIRKRIGTNAEAALAADVSGGVWSHYESEEHPSTTLPLHRFLMVANRAERQVLIDLLALEDDARPNCATTEASEATEAAADLQRTVRQAMADGMITPFETREIVAKAMDVKAQADDVIQAVTPIKRGA